MTGTLSAGWGSVLLVFSLMILSATRISARPQAPDPSRAVAAIGKTATSGD
jgi:hypothetical protein